MKDRIGLILLAISTLGLPGWAGTASAGIVYTQAPQYPSSVQSAWSSSYDSSPGGLGNVYRTYDNFSLAQTATVTNLSWQGFAFDSNTLGATPNTITGFKISFYSSTNSARRFALFPDDRVHPAGGRHDRSVPERSDGDGLQRRGDADNRLHGDGRDVLLALDPGGHGLSGDLDVDLGRRGRRSVVSGGIPFLRGRIIRATGRPDVHAVGLPDGRPRAMFARALRDRGLDRPGRQPAPSRLDPRTSPRRAPIALILSIARLRGNSEGRGR